MDTINKLSAEIIMLLGFVGSFLQVFFKGHIVVQRTFVLALLSMAIRYPLDSSNMILFVYLNLKYIWKVEQDKVPFSGKSFCFEKTELSFENKIKKFNTG